jgi:hypothetical protein
VTGTFNCWDITRAEISEFRRILELANDERPLQKYLEEHPELLGGNNGRRVIPQKRLGAEFVPDFLMSETNSGGTYWTLVELQSPRTNFFTKSGRPTKQLDEGIRQILEWRRWLAANRDYAQRSNHRNGLGLGGIDDKAKGLLLIGRERYKIEAESEQLRQLEYNHRISIHTYDWLARRADRVASE